MDKGYRKIKTLINKAKRERDRKGYRENLGYDSQGTLENYLETLDLSYAEESVLLDLFWSECDKI